VSVPLAWEELSPAMKSNHFTVANLVARLRSSKRDPWAKIDQVKQTLPARAKPKLSSKRR
jgi:bifunctional non-homologous end joining protein LigD